MIGTNDVSGNVDVAAAPARLGKLIDDITTRAPNALLVVATIIPIANDGTNPKVQTYNAALPALVSARTAAGKHVVLLDNYAAFTKDPSYRTKLMSDYLHPNDAGCVVLGRAMFEAIRALPCPQGGRPRAHWSNSRRKYAASDIAPFNGSIPASWRRDTERGRFLVDPFLGRGLVHGGLHLG